MGHKVRNGVASHNIRSKRLEFLRFGCKRAVVGHIPSLRHSTVKPPATDRRTDIGAGPIAATVHVSARTFPTHAACLSRTMVMGRWDASPTWVETFMGIAPMQGRKGRKEAEEDSRGVQIGAGSLKGVVRKRVCSTG